MVDDDERHGLQVALQAAIRDRDRAEATISFLTEKLGLSGAASAVLLNPGEGPDASEVSNVGPVHVGDSEFYGLSQTKAAMAFLQKAGRSRPQKTEQIIAALAKGGVRVGGKDPAGTFYKILNRRPEFTRVGPNLWGLAALYPNAPKKPVKADQGAEAQESAPEASPPADDSGEAPTDDDTPAWMKEPASADE